MRQETKLWSVIGREIMLAAGVLALIFLSFGHQTSRAYALSAPLWLPDGSQASFCGTSPLGQGGAVVHAQCDACRIVDDFNLASGACAVPGRYAVIRKGALSHNVDSALGSLLTGTLGPRAPPSL